MSHERADLDHSESEISSGYNSDSVYSSDGPPDLIAPHFGLFLLDHHLEIQHSAAVCATVFKIEPVNQLILPSLGTPMIVRGTSRHSRQQAPTAKTLTPMNGTGEIVCSTNDTDDFGRATTIATKSFIGAVITTAIKSNGFPFGLRR